VGRFFSSLGSIMSNPQADEAQEFTRAIVVKEHSSENDDAQLNLRLNDILYVLERDPTGWWGGHKEGEDNTGWFPFSCVRALPDDEPEVPQSEDQVNREQSQQDQPIARPDFNSAAFETETAHGYSPETSLVESPRRRVRPLATTPTPVAEHCDIPMDEIQARIEAKDQEISALRSEVAETKRKSDVDRRSLAAAKEAERKKNEELEEANLQKKRAAAERDELRAQLEQERRNFRLDIQKYQEAERALAQKDSDLRTVRADAKKKDEEINKLRHEVQNLHAQQTPSSAGASHEPPVAQVADDVARRKLLFSQGWRDSRDSTSQRLCWPAGEGRISNNEHSDAQSQSSQQDDLCQPGLSPAPVNRKGWPVVQSVVPRPDGDLTPGRAFQATASTASTTTPATEPVPGSVAEKVNFLEKRCTTQSPARNLLSEAVRRGPNGSPIATPMGSWRSGSRTRTQDTSRATPCKTKASPATSRPLPCIDLVLQIPDPEDDTEEAAVVLGMEPIRSARPMSRGPAPVMQASSRDGSPRQVAAHRSPCQNPRESAVPETSVRERMRMFGM